MKTDRQVGGQNRQRRANSMGASPQFLAQEVRNLTQNEERQAANLAFGNSPAHEASQPEPTGTQSQTDYTASTPSAKTRARGKSTG